MIRDAVLSSCGTYRYVLERDFRDYGKILEFVHERPLLWVMLNPSTADALQDDATVRRVVGFSKAWGYPGCVVVNLFAYRATQPSDLLRAGIDPVGPANDNYIRLQIARCAPQVVCAWGGNRLPMAHLRRPQNVLSCLRPHAARCLGTTREGNNPLHPLRLAKDTALVPYRPVGACTSCGAGWPGARRDHESQCKVAYVHSKKEGEAWPRA